jgi:hypothetical protein
VFVNVVHGPRRVVKDAVDTPRDVCVPAYDFLLGVPCYNRSDCTWYGSLCGKYTDDLDLHVTTPRCNKVFYRNKHADGCTLDFDANVNHGEKDPCENISVTLGTFQVYVDNFTRCTFYTPIPFKVLCRQEGIDDVFYDGTWEPDRETGRMVHVWGTYVHLCAHTGVCTHV